MDRNLSYNYIIRHYWRSLSARRAWIEMLESKQIDPSVMQSLSARRAWIEMTYVTRLPRAQVSSLSARRAWIEIKD